MHQTVPKWHLELNRFQSFKTTFILEGNIYDLHAFPGEKDGQVSWNLCKLDEYLYRYLMASGYSTVVFYNHVDGFYNDFDPSHLNTFLSRIKPAGPAPTQQKNPTGQSGPENSTKQTSYAATIGNATEMIRSSMAGRDAGAKAVVLNMASRYITSPESLSDEERFFYSQLFLATMEPTQIKTEKGLLYNLLFIVVNKTNDVPAWFYLDNPYLKVIHVTKPDKKTRARFIETQLRFFLDADKLGEEELKKSQEKFVDLTEGLKNIELNGLKVLCRQEKIPLSKISEAINLYKYGIKDNPWNDISESKLNNLEQEIRKRVKGQGPAVLQTLDIIKRAVSGLAGLQHSASSSKPKGILFFAGPTGTGKTELAKTLANLLFGDDSACIRFDMSEYQQSHSDQKLLGAPPGYVGYESGGQLTNAIKEKPFSILLFDEIEKAHASIFDKFLQILEDGRMTDGQGDTVYFSECIIIFTSNLGIYVRDESGQRVPNVSIEITEYEEIRSRIIAAIKDYFILELGRPEILNRIGDNFVVFDYIRDEVAHQIIESQLKKIRQSLQESKGVILEIDQPAIDFITTKARANLENGGRGIGNTIEKHLINPLSRYMFDNRVEDNIRLSILTIQERDGVTVIECERGKVND